MVHELLKAYRDTEEEVPGLGSSICLGGCTVMHAIVLMSNGESLLTTTLWCSVYDELITNLECI
jgi:hypothetical protein